MSIKAMTWVWDHSKADGTALLIALALADYADEQGWSWPSVATLGTRGRCSASSVHRALLQLEELKELERVSGRDTGTSSRYRLLAGVSQSDIPPSQDDRGGLSQLRQTGSVTADRQNHHLTVNEPPPGAVAMTEADQQLEQLVDDLRTMRTDWSGDSIRRALRAATVDRPFELVATAARIVAADPTTDVLGRLSADGVWWREARKQLTPTQRAKADIDRAKLKRDSEQQRARVERDAAPVDVVRTRAAEIRAQLREAKR